MLFTDSLKKNDDFKNVYAVRRSRADRFLVMYIAKNGTKSNRLGISVSKKVGNSVVRHRIKRLVKESYRLHEAVFNSGLDIVVVARQEAKEAGFKEIENTLLHLGKLHSIVSI